MPPSNPLSAGSAPAAVSQTAVPSQLPPVPGSIQLPPASQLNPFLVAAAAKGFLHPSHPFHQLNNRLLNMPPFLPPNSIPPNHAGNASGNLANNKTNPAAHNGSPNMQPKEMGTTADKTILKDNLSSSTSLHLQPLLRSLSAAAAAVQQSNEPLNGEQTNKSLLPPNFSMLPQSMHQLLHPLFASNLDAAMLNQSANQINHSLNSNSSLISNSSTSSSPVPFSGKSQNNDKSQHNKSSGSLMTTSDLLNKLSRAELNQSLNINVEDDEDFEILDLENDGESEDLELDVDSGNDFDQSMEKNESCISNEELNERIASAKSNCKEPANDFDMSRSPQQIVANNLPSLSSNNNLMLSGSTLPPKPIAVHPLKNFPTEQPTHNLPIAVSLASNVPMASQPRLGLPSAPILPSNLGSSSLSNPTHHSTAPTTNTTSTAPFFNSAASFLQHSLINEGASSNSFCQTANPVWPFAFDSNAAAMAAAKFAQFLNNNNNK